MLGEAELELILRRTRSTLMNQIERLLLLSARDVPRVRI